MWLTWKINTYLALWPGLSQNGIFQEGPGGWELSSQNSLPFKVGELEHIDFVQFHRYLWTYFVLLLSKSTKLTTQHHMNFVTLPVTESKINFHHQINWAPAIIVLKVTVKKWNRVPQPGHNRQGNFRVFWVLCFLMLARILLW